MTGIVGNLVAAVKYQAYVVVINDRFVGPRSNVIKFRTSEKRKLLYVRFGIFIGFSKHEAHYNIILCQICISN